MLELILRTAKTDERIRAVFLNGSRANPAAPKDRFQDFDIVYAVTETASFLADPEWISVFGELIMMQEPDRMDHLRGQKVDFGTSYSYLMLFSDGNRLDLRLLQKDNARRAALTESQTVVLLDKDGIIPPLQPATDRDYWVSPPTPAAFNAAANEFFWCSQNVAKGLWRDELPYAKAMMDSVVRVPLDAMMHWHIGHQYGYEISPGKMGKYYKQLTSPDVWRMYEQTYAGSSHSEMWDSLFAAITLFRKLAAEIAPLAGSVYPDQDDCRMTRYLEAVRSDSVSRRQCRDSSTRP